MVERYDPNNSPSNLGVIESIQLASGRRELGIKGSLEGHSVEEVVTHGGRRLRGNTLTAMVAAGALLAAGTFGDGALHNSSSHHGDARIAHHQTPYQGTAPRIENRGVEPQGLVVPTGDTSR